MPRFLSFALILSHAAFLNATSPVDHQTQQTPPIKLGVTGGNVNDRSACCCCSGTLGARVPINGTSYIISNNHVLARVNLAQTGEDINHPGGIDQACGQSGVIGNLAAFVPINFSFIGRNRADVAIALPSNPADVSDEVLGVGIPDWTSIQPASLGMPVIKAGRTTGVTTGTVGALNVTVNVGLAVVCGGAVQTARFTRQLRFSTPGFSSGGDSGSVIFENIDDGSIRPVGLLFAGGGNDTFANKIGSALSLVTQQLRGSRGGPDPELEDLLEESGWDVGLRRASDIKERYSEYLLSLPEVLGHGVSYRAGSRNAVIEVYVKSASAPARIAIPARLEDIDLVVHETGEIRATPDCSTCQSKVCKP